MTANVIALALGWFVGYYIMGELFIGGILAYLNMRPRNSWFRFGRCRLCGRWTRWILRSENAHEECWLHSK